MMKNISRIKAYNSILWEYFGIEFNDFMLKGKELLYYKNIKRMIKLYCIICGK